MKNFIVLVFLLITTKAYGGVWYYGTGEAVNLENQIGFQNEPNVKINADTNDLIGSWFGNELSLDPSRSDDNLLKNGDFENGIVEYACTNATAAIVNSTAPTQNNAKMFQMTVSVIGGYCDFTATTGAALEGILFRIAGQFQTSLAGVEYCTLVNGVVDNCIPVSAKATWTDPLATQSQAGATSAAIRVRSTTVTGVVNADKLKLNIGGLPTGPTISCNGDLDCENTFSAYSSSTGVVSRENFDFINGNATKVGTGVYDYFYNSGFATATPNCIPQADSTTAPNVDIECHRKEASSDETKLRVECKQGGTVVDFAHTISCQKAAPDFKPITQQGVVNVGTSNAMELVVSSASVLTNQTVGAATVTVDFPDTVRARGISWNGTTDEATFLESGKVKLSANLILFNGTTPTDFAVFPEIDTGAGFSPVSEVEPIPAYLDASNSSTAYPNIEFTFRVKAGNKVRLRVTSGNANSVLLGNTAARYQTMSIDSVVDQQTIAASMIDRKIYDGNEYLAGEIAVVGGVEKTVYRRCYNIATNIDTTTSIATIATNLNPTEWKPVARSVRDLFYGDFSSVSSSEFARLTYQKSTGVIQCFVEGTAFSCNAGTNFCFKYYK